MVKLSLRQIPFVQCSEFVCTGSIKKKIIRLFLCIKFVLLTLFGRLTDDSSKILEWEKSFLGLELISSGLVGGGVGLATNSFKEFKKGEIIAQFFGRFIVIPKSATDEVFDPKFMGNHNRLIELGPVMQPIVYSHHATLDECTQVSPLRM